MQYGLHTVGLTSHTSRLLDQRDARYLRAISRSPSHITRESTDELRRRLKVASPLQALCKMLNRRAEKCASAVGREAFAQLGDRLRLLHNGTADDNRVQGALIEVDACNPVACNVCGQYFSSMRHMKSHRTRQHGKTPKPPMPASLQYVSQTVDGMPPCLHCLRLFTRVEGLKKHLRGSCRILHQASVPVAATALSGEVPPAREALLGYSHRTPHAATAPEPLMHRPQFRSAVSQNWRRVLVDPATVNELRNYCVICAQWVSFSGGIKQHMRLVHAAEWKYKSEASARCSGLGLVAVTPCRYCTRPVKDPRAHLAHCMPVFQASLTALLIQSVQEHGSGRQGDGRSGSPAGDGSLGSPRDGAANSSTKPVLGTSRDIPEPGGGCGPPLQVAETPGFKGQSGRQGKGSYHGSWKDPNDPGLTSPRLWERRRRSSCGTWPRC